MTDKEWIVAYKCCYIEGLCNECPAHNTHNCTSLAEDIFDLINRLDAKREEWSRSASAEKLKNIELQAAFENSVKATKHWHREAELNANEIIKLQAEIENLKNTLYDAEGVNLVNYWYQQCEIAENGCRNLEEDNKKLQSEIEQWKEEANRYQTLWCEDVQIARAEAIKEFAEKLADVFYSHDKGDTYVREVVYNLVKEMAGDE